MKIADFPNEIQHRILSYLTFSQDPVLCRDIQHYTSTLPELLEFYYRKYMIEMENDSQDLDDLRWLLNDICAYMNDFFPLCLGYREHFLYVCRRNFAFRSCTNEKIIEIIERINRAENVYLSKRYICQIYGILTCEERDNFIESVKSIYDD
jgi:hypothetical protein